MDSSYYREKSERCRLLRATTGVPEVKEQLGVWVHDFDDLAEAADRRHERLQRLRDWRTRMRRALAR